MGRGLGRNALGDRHYGDGLSDTREALLGTNPNDPDSDSDGFCDGAFDAGGACTAGPDNCPLIVNSGQANNDAFAAGDLCQCGNVDGTGGIDAGDLQSAREYLVERSGGGPFDLDFCDVNGDGECDVADLYHLDRAINGGTTTITDDCLGYSTP